MSWDEAGGLERILSARRGLEEVIRQVDEPTLKMVVFSLSVDGGAPGMVTGRRPPGAQASGLEAGQGGAWGGGPAGFLGGLLALPGAAVREIVPAGQVWFVPGCPPGLEGVANVRGEIESVIDLAQVLGGPPSARPDGAILLARGRLMRSGIRVGRVWDVVDVPQSALSPAPSGLPERLLRVASGLMLHGGEAVAVLDVDRIFDGFQGGLE